MNSDRYLSQETFNQLKEWGCIFTDTNYDIIWDVCIRDPKKLFGESPKNPNHPNWEKRTQRIMELAQSGRKTDAEKYLLEHTIFNPINR